ncbi:hypothetical protein [Facilibium subflavum]|uniref:hypothetical protein n=1 Tax=Facilibium subflavum TaxID=2219058 RepID=UPI000E654721|nr:hypothetical protein [Facilibium subflavum]
MADNKTDIAQAIHNFFNILAGNPHEGKFGDSILTLLNFSLALIGFALVVYGLIRIIRHAKKEQSFHRHSPGATFFCFVSGALLILLPALLPVFQSTYYTDNTSLYYCHSSDGRANISSLLLYQCLLDSGQATGRLANDPNIAAVLSLFYFFVMVIGLISFARGLYLLTVLGEHQRGQATAGQVVIYIVGGIAAINAEYLINVIQNTVHAVT